MFNVSVNHRVVVVVVVVVVVISARALRYKSEGRGFDWNVSLT